MASNSYSRFYPDLRNNNVVDEDIYADANEGDADDVPVVLNNESSAASSNVTFRNDWDASRRDEANARTADNCPICLEGAVLPVKTSCAHTFCGSCLQGCWEHAHWTGAMDCPLCRRKIDLILPCWSTSSEQFVDADKVYQVKRFVQRYNWRFGGEPRSWWQKIREYPMLLQHFWDSITHLGNHITGADAIGLIMQARVFILILSTLLYVISPLDLIPELLFGILGTVDDVSIVVLVGAYIASIWRTHVVDAFSPNQ